MKIKHFASKFLKHLFWKWHKDLSNTEAKFMVGACSLLARVWETEVPSGNPEFRTQYKCFLNREQWNRAMETWSHLVRQLYSKSTKNTDAALFRNKNALHILLSKNSLQHAELWLWETRELHVANGNDSCQHNKTWNSLSYLTVTTTSIPAMLLVVGCDVFFHLTHVTRRIFSPNACH